MTSGIRLPFATLLRWYRDGGDVQARLPTVSAYLGHRRSQFDLLVPAGRSGAARAGRGLLGSIPGGASR